ncbi:hypothetical protein ACTHSJ_33300, partial [Paenibacillus cellulositrophicus]|uniref:hypothetical protein n=1 Tax=Paenibacillus cellulositrophicus TaxID=562959 RepID=UPI003F7FF0A5
FRKLPLNDSEYAIASSLKRNYAKHSSKRFILMAQLQGIALIELYPSVNTDGNFITIIKRGCPESQ